MKISNLLFWFVLILNCDNEATSLDTTFGASNTGMVVTSLGDPAFAYAVALDVDDSSIVAGGVITDSIVKIALVRYTADGVVDTTFGTNGIVTTEIGSQAFADSVVVDALGNIVITGTAVIDDVSYAIVVRYDSLGNLDATFGTGGIVSVLIGEGAAGFAVAIDGSGRIVVGGVVTINGLSRTLFLRFNTNGSADNTFGISGQASYAIGIHSVISSIAIDSNNNIVGAGYTTDSFTNDFLVVRLTSNGALDLSFNTVGYASTTIESSPDNYVDGVVTTASNQVVLGGFFKNTVSEFNNVGLARYTVSGAMDATFGVSGVVTAAVGTISRANAIILDASEKIIVAISSDDDFALQRYNTNGTLDTTFGTAGTMFVNMAAFDVAADIKLQSDGKIVIAGTSDDQFSLARLNADASPFVTIGSPANGSTLSTRAVSVSGVSAPFSKQVELLINNVAFTTVPTDGSGNWSGGTTSLLSDGVNRIKANLLISGVAVASYVSKFTVAGTDAILTTVPANGVSISPATTTTISGTATLPSKPVIVLLDGVFFATTTTNSAGVWSAGVTGVLVVGTHMVTATLTDSGGSVLATSQTTFTV